MLYLFGLLDTYVIIQLIFQLLQPLCRRRMTNSGLGESISSGERRLFRGASVFTVMSYNVLADELMQRHKHDLYRSEYLCLIL